MSDLPTCIRCGLKFVSCSTSPGKLCDDCSDIEHGIDWPEWDDESEADCEECPHCGGTGWQTADGMGVAIECPECVDGEI